MTTTKTRLQRLAAVRRLCATGEARQIRESSKLSLSEVADDVAVTPTAIWGWETGSRKPRGDAALRYGEVLDSLRASQ